MKDKIHISFLKYITALLILLQCFKQFIKVFENFIFLFAYLIQLPSSHSHKNFALLYYMSSTQLSCKLSDFQSSQPNYNIILINSTLSAKSVYYCKHHNYLHINLSPHFHHPNQHDLPNWTVAHSTSEIGHWTLDPPAPNRKSVLIPIV